jgi:seryl-tRNA synthetase
MEQGNLKYQNSINWINIATAGLYYQGLGYQYVEVPWIVPSEIIKITFDGLTDFRTPKGDLVGSGEQSFLYLQKAGELSPGKYHTITPCFRDEEETQWNFKQFLKLELYITDDVSETQLQHVIDDCKNCLEKITLKKIKQVKMGDYSYDLMCQGIELGSYAIMKYQDLSWICATGIAEPRTSQVSTLNSVQKTNSNF